MTKKQQCKLYHHEVFSIIEEYVVVIILGLYIPSTLFHITYSPLSEPNKIFLFKHIEHNEMYFIQQVTDGKLKKVIEKQ